jgi:amino acid adenylation domain-containing protein
VSFGIDLRDIAEAMNREEPDPTLLRKFENCCFKKNPYIHRFESKAPLEVLPPEKREKNGLTAIRTHRKNYAAVNHAVFKILNVFDGRYNLKSIFNGLRDQNEDFVVFDLHSLTHFSQPGFENKEIRFSLNGEFENFVAFIKTLYSLNLVDFIDYKPGFVGLDLNIGEAEEIKSEAEEEKDLKNHDEKNASYDSPGKPAVLLLGGTAGTASVGLLYLSSFLRRNGIDAHCQWNDLAVSKPLLKENIEKLLKKTQPRVVAVSMKWFPHIARVFEICKIVKEYSSSIKVVVGGNTASYYGEDIIRRDHIDYVVMGDGEVPLLKICKNEKNIPNCLTKEAGKIINTGINYVQNEENSAPIYLSHLDEIFVTKENPFYADFFLVYTGKGCNMSCFFCGGCLTAQKKGFNRPKPFLRGIEEVRKDLIEAKKYTSTIMFDFDLPTTDTLDYNIKILQGIDLSNHFCDICLWRIPTPEFLELISKTFKYVYLNIDMGSLSETHRAKLDALKVVKPQPTDKELFDLFERCKKLGNIEVVIDLIAGLPYFGEEDIRCSEEVLSTILKKYTCFSGIDWGRLHAQPGAPLTRNSDKYGMKSLAKTYEDFLKYSELNLKEDLYPDLEKIHYPYIYSQDENLNSKISKYYFDTGVKIKENAKKKKNKPFKMLIDITYGQLNSRSNKQANLLQRKGVVPGTIVGITAEQPREIIVGILAILKAGGAYLPIDPAYPEKRKKYMLANSGVGYLVTGLEVDPGFKVPVTIDIARSSSYMEEDGGNIGTTAKSPDAAYVIYTSGTTGKPKGVMVEHRSAVNTLLCRKEEYQMGAAHTSLQLFSYSFDGFVTSFFTPVISGARVIMPERKATADIDKLKEIIANHKVTHILSIPALYGLMIDNLTGEEAASLRVVTLAGDKLSPRILEKSKEKNPDIEIANEYGVTEAAVMSTIYRHQEGDSRITIGRPIWNTQVYITGPGNCLQPIGIPGELCTAGSGLARGYLNNPELTAEKFSFGNYPDQKFCSNFFKSLAPGRAAGGKKSYKTGDLARWLPEGNIELLGRVDSQVKIRGYRIELEEIEKQLSNHDEIKEAVVIDRQDEHGQKYLCAYFVYAGASSRPDKDLELKEYLSQHLPAYMVPSFYIRLDKIPLTPNGKIDKKNLPGPEITTEEDYMAPRDEIERKLVEAWSEILKIKKEAISINSNFFEYGGHSLSASILTAKIEKELNVKVPLIKMFEKPTIMGLSEYMQKAEKNGKRIDDENLVLLKQGISEAEHIFFIHDVTGEVGAYIELCGYLNSEFNFWGIKAGGFENLMPRNITINGIAAEYIEKIKKIQAHGPYHIAGWSLGGLIAYEIVRQLEEKNESTGLLAIIDSYTRKEDVSGKVSEFSIASELEFIRNLVEDKNEKEEISEELKKVKEYKEIWNRAVDYFGSHEKSREAISNVIAEYNMQRVLPEIKQLSIRDKIYYINIIRSINNALLTYKPVRTIHSSIHFFKADGSKDNRSHVPWDYNTQENIIAYELPGDHFSILTAPDVKNIAIELDRAVNSE